MALSSGSPVKDSFPTAWSGPALRSLSFAAAQSTQASGEQHMVDHNLIQEIGIDEEQIDALVQAAYGATVAAGDAAAPLPSGG